jgi:lysophospholipase L1-like esterase
MQKTRYFAIASLIALLSGNSASAEAPKACADGDYVEAMRKVHARFKGRPGTFAQFGDSITETLAFWTPILYDPKGMSPQMAAAREKVIGYLRKECWRDWKGAEFGSQGKTTIDWADEHLDEWLKKLDPEVVSLLFGTNDMRQGNATDFGRKLRDVVRRILDNGSIVILTTPPPRSGMVEKSKQFAAVVREVAAEFQLPLIDYQAEIFKRRPLDWDGTGEEFKDATREDHYQAPTLISGDGVHPSNPSKYSDWSEEALRHNGYTLRSYLTLMKYAEVLQTVIKADMK